MLCLSLADRGITQCLVISIEALRFKKQVTSHPSFQWSELLECCISSTVRAFLCPLTGFGFASFFFFYFQFYCIFCWCLLCIPAVSVSKGSGKIFFLHLFLLSSNWTTGFFPRPGFIQHLVLPQILLPVVLYINFILRGPKILCQHHLLFISLCFVSRVQHLWQMKMGNSSLVLDLCRTPLLLCSHGTRMPHSAICLKNR